MMVGQAFDFAQGRSHPTIPGRLNNYEDEINYVFDGCSYFGLLDSNICSGKRILTAGKWIKRA
jgi:hypothetical protein